MKRHLAWTLLLAAACGNSKPPEAAHAEPSSTASTSSTPAPTAEPVAAPTNSDDVKKGLAAMKSGDYNGARSAFEAAIAKNPKQADAHFYLAQMMEKTGDKAAAEAGYKRALEAQPDLVDAAVNLIALYIESKKYDDAIALAKKLLEKNPKDPMMRFNYAVALAGKGDQDNARKEYDAALKLAPNNAELYLSYAHQLIEWKKNDAAMTRLKQAEGIASSDAGVLASIAVEYKNLRAFPECVSALDKAVTAKDGAEVRFLRGVCKLAQKDLPGATTDFQFAADKEPARAEYHYSLGNALADGGKLKEAIDQWDACIKAKPNGPLVPGAQKRIGIAKQKLGQK
jgi:tetratricopeptide (TPR) repeat protein